MLRQGRKRYLKLPNYVRLRRLGGNVILGGWENVMADGEQVELGENA